MARLAAGEGRAGRDLQHGAGHAGRQMQPRGRAGSSRCEAGRPSNNGAAALDWTIRSLPYSRLGPQPGINTIAAFRLAKCRRVSKTSNRRKRFLDDARIKENPRENEWTFRQLTSGDAFGVCARCKAALNGTRGMASFAAAGATLCWWHPDNHHAADPVANGVSHGSSDRTAGPGNDDAIEATLNYIVDTGEKIFTETGGAGSSDTRTSGGTLDPHKVVIHNGRPQAGEFALDRDGFRFVDHDTKVKDFFDEAEVRRVYYAEMEALMKAESGAKRVVVFDHTLRTADDALRAGAEDPRSGDARPQRLHRMVRAAAGARLLPDEAEALLAAPLRHHSGVAADPPSGRNVSAGDRRREERRADDLSISERRFPTVSARPTPSPTTRRTTGTGSRACGARRRSCSRCSIRRKTAAPAGPRTPPSTTRPRRRRAAAREHRDPDAGVLLIGRSGARRSAEPGIHSHRARRTHFYVEVAFAVAIEHGHALVGVRNELPDCVPSGIVSLCSPSSVGTMISVPMAACGNGDWNDAVNVVAFTFKEGVLLHVQDNV